MMSLDTIIDDVFRRGCGVSRTRTLQSTHFRELTQSLPHVTHTTKLETAEMVVLGEKLADRAFQNLPVFFRETAREWAEQGPGDPLLEGVVLDMLMEEFTSHKWAKRRGMVYQRGRPSCDVLPATMKSWLRGKEQPNCLGLTQMMVGFARATGRRHYMVNVVSPHHEMMPANIYLALGLLVKVLKPRATSRALKLELKTAMAWQASCLRLMAEDSDLRVHHAIALEMPTGWVVLDPYLNRRYMLRFSPARAETAWRHTRKLRGHFVQSNNEAAQRIAYLRSALEKMIGAIHRFNRSNGTIDVDTLVEQILEDLFAATFARSKDFKELYSRLYGELLTSLVASKHFLKQYSALPDKDSQDEYFERARKRVSTSRYFQRFALQRLLAEVARKFMLGLVDIDDHVELEHPLVELHHAEYNLAVMTLNHHAGKIGHPAAELIRFSGSQVIIRDTLAEVQEGDSTLLKRVMQHRLRGLKKLPGSMVMPDLSAHIP